MKNISHTYAFVGVIIVVIGIAFFLQNLSNQTVSTQPNQDQISSSTQTSSDATPAPAPKPAIKVTPVSSTGNYQTYITQLRLNEGTCNTASSDMYKKLYSSLSNSSFMSYFNPSSGMCYVKVIGKSQLAYATTTTGHIYLRNVNKDSLVAECTDPTGTMLADANWICMNKVTGQTINKAQFEALVQMYAVK